MIPENPIAAVFAVINTTGFIAPFTHDVVAVYRASLMLLGIAAACRLNRNGEDAAGCVSAARTTLAIRSADSSVNWIASLARFLAISTRWRAKKAGEIHFSIDTSV